MATINQLARERRAAVRDLIKKLKAVDTAVEVGERFLKRIISRKNKVPESAELEIFMGQVKGMDIALDQVIKEVDLVHDVFT